MTRVRIRQVALVARELDPVVDDLCGVFDLAVAFHDPGVEVFGLRNAVLPVGDTFLEVVSPVRPGTTAGRLLDRRGGDGGYMVIFQTSDLGADRARLAGLGVRIVWEITLDDIAAVHLHPRDVGGAIVSFDEPRPSASWRWAGPTWQDAVRTDVVRAISGVTIAALDPARMAARWTAVLGVSAGKASATELRLERSVIRFVAADEHGEGVVAVTLATVDGERARANAERHGLPTDAGGIRIGGVLFDLAADERRRSASGNADSRR